MKLFSVLGSCFYGGGATVIPASAAETRCISLRSSSVQQDDEKRGLNLNRSSSGRSGSGGSSNEVVAMIDGMRKMKSANTSRNWKPKLHVISEDSVVIMANHDRSSSAVRSDDKLSVKRKAPKSKPKAPSYTHGDGYWKSSSLWAIPAFSPTPFLF